MEEGVEKACYEVLLDASTLTYFREVLQPSPASRSYIYIILLAKTWLLRVLMRIVMFVNQCSTQYEYKLGMREEDLETSRCS